MVEIPAKYVVRTYLREREKIIEALGSLTTNVLIPRWREMYASGPATSAMLASIGVDFAEVMPAHGAFLPVVEHIEGTRHIPFREKLSASAFFAEPVSIGQGFAPSENRPYLEKAMMLRTVQIELKRKKGYMGVGFSSISLTQHVLERVYERKELNYQDFEQELHEDITDLMRGLALAECANVYVASAVEGETYRFTAVPFKDGLMIVNNRLIFGDIGEGDFGWRVKLPSSEMETPFVNVRRLFKTVANDEYFSNSFTPTVVDCGVTYYNSITFNDQQADYYYAFQAAKEHVGHETLDEIARATYSPTLAHDRGKTMTPSDAFSKKIARLKVLLEAGWLKPKSRVALGYLLPYDHEIPRNI